MKTGLSFTASDSNQPNIYSYRWTFHPLDQDYHPIYLVWLEKKILFSFQAHTTPGNYQLFCLLFSPLAIQQGDLVNAVEEMAHSYFSLPQQYTSIPLPQPNQEEDLWGPYYLPIIPPLAEKPISQGALRHELLFIRFLFDLFHYPDLFQPNRSVDQFKSAFLAAPLLHAIFTKLELHYYAKVIQLSPQYHKMYQSVFTRYAKSWGKMLRDPEYAETIIASDWFHYDIDEEMAEYEKLFRRK